MLDVLMIPRGNMLVFTTMLSNTSMGMYEPVHVPAYIWIAYVVFSFCRQLVDDRLGELTRSSDQGLERINDANELVLIQRGFLHVPPSCSGACLGEPAPTLQRGVLEAGIALWRSHGEIPVLELDPEWSRLLPVACVELGVRKQSLPRW